MTDETRPEQPSAPSEMEQLRDTAQTLQTIVNRVREALGTDEPAPVKESYRVRVFETRASDAEYERDVARGRAEAASRAGTGYMFRAERAEAVIERARILASSWQEAMRPGEPHPAATALLATLDEQPGPAATEATEAAAPALRQQLRAAIEPTLLEYPEHNRTDEHEELLGEIVTAVLAAILPDTRTTAALARRSEADVQRVIALYEQWVKAGAPPLGVSMSRWWDARLVELHDAILPPADQTKAQQ